MSIHTVAVIGATGLIGSHLVAQLQKQKDVERIKVLVRRPVQFEESKVEMKLVNFDDPESFKLALEECDAVFCAVGTTQKKVKGDKAAYRKVDYNIPVNAAMFCAETGCQNFLLVSSVGANSKSGNFYLKLKGEVEDKIREFSINSISVFRPSILLGERKEKRPGERIGQVVTKAFSFLLAGSWQKYKPVQAAHVAEAMIAVAKKGEKGFAAYEYAAMEALRQNSL